MENKKRRNLWQVIFGILAIYLIFLVYQALNFNYLASNKIKTLRKEASYLDAKKSQLEDLIVYYKTDTFKELEARKKLGMRKPGESVLIVKTLEEEAKAQLPKADIEGMRTEPNYLLWIKLFRNNLEEQ